MLCGRTDGELARLFDRTAVHLAQTLLPNRADARILCQTLGKQLAPRVFEAAWRRGFKPCFLFVRRAKTCHIMLEGLIWQTHRQPAAGAAAISLILPTASWQIG